MSSAVSRSRGTAVGAVDPAGSAVRLRTVRKSYGATVAVHDIDLNIAAGSVHGIVGENGAGKSTVGKLIAGVEPATAGSIELWGRAVSFRNPHEALLGGVARVAQEVSLVHARSVVENVFLGRDRGPARTKRRDWESALSRLMSATGFALDPRARVGSLNVGDQQKVEILRALSRDARVIVFDEPTAALSTSDRAQVRSTIRRLARDGVTVIYISHHLEEVLETTDVVTVMRDGRVTGTHRTEQIDERTLVREMLGGIAVDAYPDKAPVGDGPVMVSLRGVTTARLTDVDLDLHAGEILGVAGLLGSGRTALGRVVGGSAKVVSGTLAIQGAAVKLNSPRHAHRRGIGSIPEDRANLGLLRDQSVLWNVALPHLSHFQRGGLLVMSGIVRSVRAALNRAAGQPWRLADPVGVLSGGNQQKVLVARALLNNPTVLIADEPTRGVDIGAKREIYGVLTDFAAAGGAVLLISSEIEEIRGLSHRILVMRSGRVVREFGSEAGEHEILEAAFGIDQESTIS